ncbi:MAG TPA: GWxTD domain-containing protein [candidate division Zixibacteria bacterium]|nr:GWxTD domain-containing protein [candidate division Zixibacteria bacterium]
MRYIWLAVVIGVMTTMAVMAEDDPNKMTVYAGATAYPNPNLDSVVLVEFPFSIKRHELEFFHTEEDKDQLESRVLALVRIANPMGQAIDSAYTYFSVRVNSTEEAKIEGIRLFNKINMLLPPGTYSARVTVIDAVSRRKGDYLIDYIYVPPPKTTVTIGGPQWAYSIHYVGDSTSNLNPRLIKNGYEVIPNPKSIYGTDDTTAYVYAEVYGLTVPEADSGRYLLQLTVLDEDREVYRELGGRSGAKPGASLVITEPIDISDWPDALYWLRLSVLDMDNNRADTTVSPFRIVSPEKLLAAYNEEPSFGAYDRLLPEERIRSANYLLTPDQKRTLNNLSWVGKRNFMDQFWTERERGQGPDEMPMREQMAERYLYCNQYFSTNPEMDDGWLSSRGRIYMIYGQYDDLVDVQAPQVADPYQIWYYYDIEQGHYFIFEDPYGDGDYKLVHSNVTTEVHSDEWEQWISEGTIDVQGY